MEKSSKLVFFFVLTNFVLLGANMGKYFILLQILLLVLWIGSLKLTSDKNIVLFIFLLMFGCFFVIPAVFVSIEVLDSDFLLGSINLSHSDVYVVLSALIIYVEFIIVFLSFTQGPTSVRINSSRCIRKIDIYIVTVLFLIVLEFYVRKISAIQSEGYAAYHLGIISVKKGLLIVFAELIFQARVILLISKRSLYGLILFLIYSGAIVLTGMRMPFILNCIVAFILFSPQSGNNRLSFKRVIMYMSVGFGIVPPILMLTNRFRQGALWDISFKEEIVNSYEELFVILGITLDTLKGAVVLRDVKGLEVSLFSRINSTFGSIWNKISSGSQLSMMEKLDYEAFGSVLTNYFSPRLYMDGLTIGSSFIAEAFFAYGYFGCILAAFLHVKFSEKINSLQVDKPFNALFILSFGYWFLNSVRNDFVGWIPLAILYYLVYILLGNVSLKVKKV